MKDIQFAADGGMFNCRVVGICIKENKIFLSKMVTDDYWAFIGGKAKFGESSDAAIIREYREEVGAHLQIDRLMAVIENFFELGGKPWHQYIFFYLLKDENNELELFDGERQIADEGRAVYKWFDLSELDSVNIKPDCSAEILKKLPKHTVHYINRDE